MSLTVIVWLAAFTVLAVLAFVRPAFAVALYMLTFFACPDFWWWGGPLAGYRWNLYAGIAMLISVVIANGGAPELLKLPRRLRQLTLLGMLIALNATLVHFMLASSGDASQGPYWLLMKFILLFLMIIAACRRPNDVRCIALSILFGAAYIGYECTINDRGQLRANRLEGIGCPSAQSANELASLMVTVLPLTGAFFMAGKPWERVAMVPTAPFILNVVLLCNSRGAFLSMIAAGLALLLFAPRRIRRKVLVLAACGGMATWFLLGDPRIIERFLTTFNSAEDRDDSAASRLDYWKAGMRMVADYPLGAGGNGFKRVHGPSYIRDVNGAEFDGRSVHNGYINEACEWGVQGCTLRLLLLGGVLTLLVSAIRHGQLLADGRMGHMLGLTIIVGLVGFLCTSFFGDRLDNEWGYWISALGIGYARAYAKCAPFSQPPASRCNIVDVRLTAYKPLATGAPQSIAVAGSCGPLGSAGNTTRP